MRAMRETEVKIEVHDAGEARRRLGLAGTVAMAPRLFEDNRVYDDGQASSAGTASCACAPRVATTL